MGTRGLIGFYYKGKFYIAYNQWDSYPEGLGANIVDEIKEAIKNGEFFKWKDRVLELKIVDPNDPPTYDDIANLSEYTDFGVSSQSTTDWYCLLRECQGSLKKLLDSGYIINYVDQNGKPLFEEYAYIINFDTNKLDFYCGNTLYEKFDFDNLPTNWT